MYNCRAVKCLNVYSYLFDKLRFKSLYKMFQNALNRHWLTYIYQWCFLLSCFIFMFQLVDYQHF